jgi:ABC-type antimicrobial peptide transport system ATPase subunit
MHFVKTLPLLIYFKKAKAIAGTFRDMTSVTADTFRAKNQQLLTFRKNIGHCRQIS